MEFYLHTYSMVCTQYILQFVSNISFRQILENKAFILSILWYTVSKRCLDINNLQKWTLFILNNIEM